MPVEDNQEDDEVLPEHDNISVGGGESQLKNIIVLGLCVLGILYGLISFLTASSE
jgi:hypothetical protein